MTNVIYIRRRKSTIPTRPRHSTVAQESAMTTGRFTGRLGRERASFAQPFNRTAVFFEILTNDGSREGWNCVIVSNLVRPVLDTLNPGDSVSVVGHLKMRSYDTDGGTWIAHSVFAIEVCPRDFPQGLRLW